MISQFQGRYRFLSNFWRCPVEYEGIVYPSSEHAYQAAKTLDLKTREQISQLSQPGQAKRFGKSIQLRPDWNLMRITVMEEIVKDKFSRNKDLQRWLLGTGDEILTEGNSWGDRFWGVCEGRGDNWLGKILTKVRENIRKEAANDSTRQR